jgi:predicted nucleic acid-binding protein
VPERIFVDAGYLIALSPPKDRHHAVARSWYVRLRRERLALVTSTAVLHEFGNELAQPAEWPRARAAIDAMAADPGVVIVSADRGLFDRAAAFKSSFADKEWGLTDCTSFLIMQESEITRALSNDHHFQQMGFRALLLDV